MGLIHIHTLSFHQDSSGASSNYRESHNMTTADSHLTPDNIVHLSDTVGTKLCHLPRKPRARRSLGSQRQSRLKDEWLIRLCQVEVFGSSHTYVLASSLEQQNC